MASTKPSEAQQRQGVRLSTLQSKEVQRARVLDVSSMSYETKVEDDDTVPSSGQGDDEEKL